MLERNSVSQSACISRKSIPPTAPSSLILLACALASSALAPCEARAAADQVLPRDTYAHAEALLGPNALRAVRNDFIVPHWTGDSDQFWYRRETVDGARFVLVDAATGHHRAAFDHAAIARALAEARGEAVRPDALPFLSFEFVDSAKGVIRFASASRSYVCSPRHCTSTVNVAAAQDALPSPDGRWNLISRGGNLELNNPATGETRSLTDDGSPDAGYGICPDDRLPFIKRFDAGKPVAPTDAHWSPDSRRILVPWIDQRQVAPYPFVDNAPADGSFRPRAYAPRLPLVGERPAKVEWYVFNLDSGTKQRLDLPVDRLLSIQQDILPIRRIEWSRDGRHIYLVAHGDNMESAFLFGADTDTAAVRTVIEDRVLPRTDLNSSSYNPVNVRILGDGREAIWFSQRDGWGHLYLYDAVTGRLKNRITSGAWLVRDIVDVDESRRLIYFTAGGREPGNPYYRYLYRVGFDGSGLKMLSPEAADHILVPSAPSLMSLDDGQAYPVVSPSGRYVVYNYSRVDQPTRTVVRRVSDRALIAQIEKADATELYAAGWRAPEEFVVKAADGRTDLWGVLYKPPGFDPGKKYPIIDSQYASPLTAATQRNFYQAYRGLEPLTPSTYAALGFVVVSVDARGTTHRSKAFQDAGYGRLARVGLDDHVAAIRQLAARYSFIDLERVGIVGHSYGGFVALRAMLDYPDVFKAGIVSAPMANVHSMFLDYHWTAFQGRPFYSDGTELRPKPTEVPSNWGALNAAAQAKQLSGDLLLQFAELDENTPPAQILQFVHALIDANKDFEMLYLPDRDHQFIGEGYVNRRDWDFLVRHLLGAEPPAGYEITTRGR